VADVEAMMFDLDDTLIVEDANAKAAIVEALAVVDGVAAAAALDICLATFRHHWRASEYHPVCAELGIASWEGLWASFEGGHVRLAGLADWAPTYRLAAWADALAALGADRGLAAVVSERYIAAQRRGHPVIPGAIETVHSLAGTPMAVVTNGPADIQRLKLAQSGLETSFDVVVISGETGVGKPGPGAFGLALDRLGVDAARTVMIGDSWERDVLGAVAIGIGAMWVSHGRAVPERIAGVRVIETLRPEVFAAS
jgi:HAD superfamily hydrolase (TIGR01549 family)